MAKRAAVAGEGTILRVYAVSEPCVNFLTNRKQAMPQFLREEMANWAAKVLEQVRAKNFSGRPYLVNRTGNLSGSLDTKTTVRKQLRTLKTEFFADRSIAPYAGVQEFGAGFASGLGLPPIQPRQAKMLAIPLSNGPAVDARGIKRYKSPLRQTLPADQGIRIVRLPDGRLFLSDKTNRFWYRLKSEVRIPPRLGFRGTIIMQIDALCSAMANRIVQEFSSA